MDMLGISTNYLVIQLLIGSWPLLSVAALYSLRRRLLTGTNQILWALMIIAVPIAGAVAFFILEPGVKSQP